MIESTGRLLAAAQQGRYAVGAFNVYNLEGVRAVIRAAEAESSPVLLQIHPAAMRVSGFPLVALCIAAAQQSSVPVSVHCDHFSTESEIQTAVSSGIVSVMADGSRLEFHENVAFTSSICGLVHSRDGFVEAELGRLSGTEDGETLEEWQANLTDPEQARRFVVETRVDALAVCIGNVHGHYRKEPRLDFRRLEAIRDAVDVPLVLHGASGLPADAVQRSIDLGVTKFNVNTELREAYMATVRQVAAKAPSLDLVDLMKEAMTAMSVVAVAKIRLFRSSGKAFSICKDRSN